MKAVSVLALGAAAASVALAAASSFVAASPSVRVLLSVHSEAARIPMAAEPATAALVSKDKAAEALSVVRQKWLRTDLERLLNRLEAVVGSTLPPPPAPEPEPEPATMPPASAVEKEEGNWFTNTFGFLWGAGEPERKPVEMPTPVVAKKKEVPPPPPPPTLLDLVTRINTATSLLLQERAAAESASKVEAAPVPVREKVRA